MSILAFVAGILFAVGLGLGGLTQPHRVTGFLDAAGTWDPTLAFVMAAALAVYALAYRLHVRRPRPLLAVEPAMPGFGRIDRPLLLGAAVFGVGWGLAGYCPGPALVSLPTLGAEAVVFVLAMGGGMAGFRVFQRRSPAHTPVSLAPAPAPQAGPPSTLQTTSTVRP